MSLNIKNEETHRLVRQLAAMTGQSQTSAVEDAVRRRLAELTREDEVQQSYRRIKAIAARARALTSEDTEWRATDWDTVLYDENGLPR